MELFVRHRDNRKRNAQRWKRRVLVLVLAAIISAAGGTLYYWDSERAAALQAVERFIFQNAYFSVREIQIRGGEKMGGSEIVALTGLRHGMNIWDVEPAMIEMKVAKHPWVRRVVVRREFPRKVVVEIEERVPKAIVTMGGLYYVDADGIVFKEVGEGENVDFPMLTGLRPEDVTASAPKFRRKIQEALRLSELMASDLHTLSEIHFDAGDRLVVYTMAHPMALHMGSGNWAEKLRRLERVLSLWKGNEDRLASLDVSFRDQVVARLRRPRQEKNPGFDP
jgi:cell division protein FtsQ